MREHHRQNTQRPAVSLHVDDDGGLAALMGTQNVTLARELALSESAILQAARDVLQTAFAEVDPVTGFDGAAIAIFQLTNEYLIWLNPDLTLRPVLAESWAPHWPTWLCSSTIPRA